MHALRTRRPSEVPSLPTSTANRRESFSLQPQLVIEPENGVEVENPSPAPEENNQPAPLLNTPPSVSTQQTGPKQTAQPEAGSAASLPSPKTDERGLSIESRRSSLAEDDEKDKKSRLSRLRQKLKPGFVRLFSRMNPSKEKQHKPAPTLVKGATEDILSSTHDTERTKNSSMSAAVGHMTTVYSPDLIEQLTCPAEYLGDIQKEALWSDLHLQFANYLKMARKDGSSDPAIDTVAEPFSRTLFDAIDVLKPVLADVSPDKDSPESLLASEHMEMTNPEKVITALTRILGLDQPGMPGVHTRGGKLVSSVDLTERPHTGSPSKTCWMPTAGYKMLPESCRTLSYNFVATRHEDHPEDRWKYMPNEGRLAPVHVMTASGQPGQSEPVMESIIASNRQQDHYIRWYRSAPDQWSVSDTQASGTPGTRTLAEVKQSMEEKGFYPTRFSCSLQNI